MNLHSVMFEKIFLYGKLFCFNTFSFHTVKGHTDSGYLKQTLNVLREKSQDHSWFISKATKSMIDPCGSRLPLGPRAYYIRPFVVNSKVGVIKHHLIKRLNLKYHP